MTSRLEFLLSAAMVFAIAFLVTAAWLRHVDQVERERVEISFSVMVA